MKRVAIMIVAFVAGVILGGVLLSGSQPRSFAALGTCDGRCLSLSDLAGLLVSAGIRTAPGATPRLVRETDKCIAIQHPLPQAKKHFVLFPKRDIKNITDVALEDGPYVLGCIDLLRALAEEKKIEDYRVVTNGPGVQLVTYLHFHLMGS